MITNKRQVESINTNSIVKKIVSQAMEERDKKGMLTMKGYKVFNPDWTCRGFQYNVGQVYEMDEKPICCNRGFHFCKKASDCFNYYPFNPDNKVAEVEALGDIDTNNDDSKYSTNKIHIIREIIWQEVLDLVNLGKGCTGLCNSGDYNSGDYNSGNYNSGNRNSGNWNSGNWNSGNWNSGNYNSGNRNSGNRNSGNWNSGNWNSGNWNSGNWNSGNWNSGDWNKSSFNNGCFNTIEPTIMMFNKPSDITYRDWLNSDARRLLNQIPKDVVEWIYSDDMTDKEKAVHPEHKITGGYLKVLDKSECSQIWWGELDNSQKKIIKSMPNFNESIFEEITGIKVDKQA
jgi:hypothetical protein